MSLDYIKRYYKVPAKRGGRVRIEGKTLGTITGAHQQYLRIRVDGEKRSGVYHPTWEIEYLDTSAQAVPERDSET